MGSQIRVLGAILCFFFWYPFFYFSNGVLRTWRVFTQLMEKLKDQLCRKILLTATMFICCTPISCAFCCNGCFSIWGEPCHSFQDEKDTMEAYHKLVYLRDNSAEPAIHDMLAKCFGV